MTDPVTTLVLLFHRITDGLIGQTGLSEGELRLLVLLVGVMVLCATVLRLLSGSKRKPKANMTDQERTQLRKIRQQRMPGELQ